MSIDFAAVIMGLAADMVWLLFSNVSGTETIAYQVYDVMAGLYTTSPPPVLAHYYDFKDWLQFT